jgi:hypothetical protein
MLVVCGGEMRGMLMEEMLELQMVRMMVKSEERNWRVCLDATHTIT